MPDLLSLSEEERLRLLIGAVTDYAIYMLDPLGRIATWNPGAEHFKGYRAQEIIGSHFSRFFTPEDVAIDLPTRALRIAAREGRYEAEGWRVRKDGTRFWAHAILDPVRADDGSLIGYAKVTRDITEKREREKALFDSEQRFRRLVEGVHDYAIYMLDRDGRITNWNAGAQAIKGYSADEIVGHHFSLFYTEEDRTRGEPDNALATALREGKYEREAWRVRKDGLLFWAHVVIDPIFDEDGKHAGFAKITRDNTDKKKAEEELEQAREALAQSQKLQALGELTGGVAHDFNNMLTVIGGASDFLLKHPDLPGDKRQRYLTAISETTERAAGLTNQLLTFGRRQSLRPQVIDVNLRLDAFAEMIGRTIGSPIEVKLDLGAQSPLVEVDFNQLETALLNGAINARDAMPDGGTLSISTKNGELDGASAICIVMQDTGRGIADEVLDRVFEPFFTTKEIGRGTGLGLSQIHGFAAQAGGETRIESEEGKGTSLTIILPRTGKALSSGAEENKIAPLPSELRVLLVEDNEQVRDFAADLLAEMQCHVEAVGSAAEALAALEKHEFDVVFSDVVMPGMSGIELARKLEQSRPELTLLLATGYSRELAVAPGQFPVVAKPYTMQSLSEAMADAIERRQTRAA